MPGSAGPGGGLAVRFLNPAAFFLISVSLLRLVTGMMIGCLLSWSACS